MKSQGSVYTFVRGDGMRIRPVWAMVGAAALVLMALGGCGPALDTADGNDLPEQDGLEVGAQAPDFRMKNQNQETVALTDYRGTKNVVLVFYPADFTPV